LAEHFIQVQFQVKQNAVYMSRKNTTSSVACEQADNILVSHQVLPIQLTVYSHTCIIAMQGLC